MRVLLIAASLMLLAGFATAQTTSRLEDKMSGEEYQAAGLNKLSPAELAYLNNWLKNRAPPPQARAPAPREDRNGFDTGADRQTVVAHIKGNFRGWHGGTQFVLDNGQVWVQTDSDVLAAVNMDNPQVTIKPGLFGSWLLKVKGYNSVAKVRRVK